MKFNNINKDWLLHKSNRGKMNILKTLAIISFTTTFFTGCTSNNEHSSDVDAKSKEFGAPSERMAGIYIYRDAAFFDF